MIDENCNTILKSWTWTIIEIDKNCNATLSQTKRIIMTKDNCNPITSDPARNLQDSRTATNSIPIAKERNGYPLLLQSMDLGAKRDEFALTEEILCFDTETAGLTDTAHCLII